MSPVEVGEGSPLAVDPRGIVLRFEAGIEAAKIAFHRATTAPMLDGAASTLNASAFDDLAE